MKLKKRLQHMLVSYKANRLKLKQFEFPALLQGNNRMIITLPEGIQTNSVLLRIVSELPGLFPESDLLIVVPMSCTEVSRKTAIHAMSPDLYSTNLIGLPKRNFFAKVKNFNATILIDFETQRNVFNAMVSLFSGAALRIGVAGGWESPIYNMLVRSSFGADELKIYRSLVDVIAEILKHSAATPNCIGEETGG